MSWDIGHIKERRVKREARRGGRLAGWEGEVKGHVRCQRSHVDDLRGVFLPEDKNWDDYGL
jgi:hypothetical protein